MIRALPLLAALLTAACQVAAPPAANETNEQAPAQLAPAPNEAQPPPATHLDPDPPRAVPDETSALGAARRLQDYCDAVATRRYADAYRLWSDEGRASGIGVDTFADGFAPYAAYDCHIGAPGRIEGAAGSLYVEIPLQVTGALKSGGGFLLDGKATMRRVNDVPGSTAEQRRWHIASLELEPRR